MVLPKRDFTSPKKIPDRNYNAIVLLGILILGILFAGCTQSAGTVPVTTVVPVPSPSPTVIVTAATTTVPQPVVTLIHYVSQMKDIRDSELLFALQVPVEWNVTSYRITNARNTEGLMYQTDLVGNNTFFIRTYAITRGQDQAYRDECRMWSPAPVEITVKINAITFDRFESTANGTTNVSYVVRKSSANERGYASVLSFTTDTSNPFEKEDFEKVVSSFRYFPGSAAGTMPGQEILRLPSQRDSSGGALSGKGGGDSGSSSDSSSGGGCTCNCRG